MQLDLTKIPSDLMYLDHYEIAIYYYNNTEGFAVHRVSDMCPYLTEVSNLQPETPNPKS